MSHTARDRTWQDDGLDAFTGASADFHALFGAVPALFAVVTPHDFTIVAVSEGFLEATSTTRHDLIGCGFFSAFPDDSSAMASGAPGLRGSMEKALATRSPDRLGASKGDLGPADGVGGFGERWWSRVNIPLIGPDGDVAWIIHSVEDVTDMVRLRTAGMEQDRLLLAERTALAEARDARVIAERALAQAEAARERTARLQSLTAALSTAVYPADVAEAVVAHATVALGAVGVLIARVSRDGTALEIMRARDLPETMQAEWQRIPLAASVPLAECARSRDAVFLETRGEWAARYPDMAHLIEQTGHHANAIAPLVAGGELLGVLGAAFDAPRTFDDDDRALLRTIAEQCSQAFERARLIEAERQARAEAEGANRAKGEFLAVMSHELRTPLNAISGYAELMEMGLHGPVTAAQREDLDRIQQSQRHLLGLINQVLNYTRVETGTVRYQLAPVGVGEALATAEALVVPQIRARRLTYVLGECDSALMVQADAEKLRQILLNLLTNAIKFTDAGGQIVVACGREPGNVTIAVRDTGIGIDPNKLSMIFEPFVQVDAQLTRTREGIGLGLAISRDLARGMSGDITAESTPGVGSTFTLRLPATS